MSLKFPCLQESQFFSLNLSEDTKKRVKNATVKTMMVAVSVLSFSTLQWGTAFAVGAAFAAGSAVVTFGCELLRKRSVSWFNTTHYPLREVKRFMKTSLKANLIFGVVSKVLGIQINQNALNLLRKMSEQFLKNPLPLLASISLTCIIAPIVEEVIFRGFLQERIEDAINLLSYTIYPIVTEETAGKIAAFVQASIFGLMHFSSAQGLHNFAIVAVTTCLGIWFGKKKETTESLLPSLSFHSILNTIVTARTLIFDVMLSKR